MKLWPNGDFIHDIASRLDRPGGDVVSRAWELDLVRMKKRHSNFVMAVPAWRIRRLRLALIEAERRGLHYA